MKKVLSLILALCMVIPMFAVPASAAGVETAIAEEKNASGCQQNSGRNSGC